MANPVKCASCGKAYAPSREDCPHCGDVNPVVAAERSKSAVDARVAKMREELAQKAEAKKVSERVTVVAPAPSPPPVSAPPPPPIAAPLPSAPVVDQPERVCKECLESVRPDARCCKSCGSNLVFRPSTFPPRLIAIAMALWVAACVPSFVYNPLAVPIVSALGVVGFGLFVVGVFLVIADAMGGAWR